MAKSSLCLSLILILCKAIVAQGSSTDDIVTIDGYEIYKCSKGPGGKEEQLQTVLRAIEADMPTILVEANTGVDSDYGFKSLFTSNDAIQTVTGNLGKISDGAEVQVGGESRKVRFVCAEADDSETSPILQSIVTAQSQAAAYNKFSTEMIYLTPLFFTLESFPAPYRCPLFRKGRPVVNSDDILGTTKYGTIIHELLDKYIHFGGLSGHTEVYRLKDCMALAPQDQLLNSENYSMFASAMKAGCTHFPRG